MAVATPYTSEARVTRLLGQLGLDLRTDDAEDGTAFDALVQDAIDAGTVDLDYYLSDYAVAGVAASDWAQAHATFFAVRWLCVHRLNEVPASLAAECERREKQLELVRVRKAVAPRIAKSRRPAVATAYHVDLRRANNQVRVDTSRSTGRARQYVRPTDGTAPDQR